MKVSSKKLQFKALVPLGLIALWVCLLLIHIFLVEKSFTLLSYSYDKGIFEGNDFTTLNGEVLSAKFTAKDNYLGIVSINFNHRIKMKNGEIIFRIKEENEPRWYYENSYDALQLNDLSLYPFGFPIIDDSVDKKYIVEVELDEADQENVALGLNNFGSVLIAHHKFPKEPLLADKASFASFLAKKVPNTFINNYQVYVIVIYLYPFLFYIGWKIAKSKLTQKSLFAIIVLTSFIDTVFISHFFSLVYLTITLLWIFAMRNAQYASKYSYKVGFGLLAVCAISQFLNFDSVAEKAASWAFMYFVAGLMFNIKEIRNI